MSITRDDTLNWVKAVATVIGENSAYLTQLDAAIGDADHGANMDRGFKAVMNKLPEISDKDIGTIFEDGWHDAHIHRWRGGRPLVWHLLSCRRV